MRAQCCICADQFENDDSINIAAVPCGHTFHEDCVMRWLRTSNSCPQCRSFINKNQVIKKLYFDAGDQPVDDSDKLVNQLSTLRTKIVQRDREKSELEETVHGYKQKAEELQESQEAVNLLYKQEQSTNTALRKQLGFFESQQRMLETEKNQYKLAQKQLRTLKEIETLLTGCESDSVQILSQYGEGEEASRQLSRYCTIIKREYEKVKTEKRTIKEHFEKARRNLVCKTHLLEERTKELSVVTEQLNRCEEDLTNSEKEKDVLRGKLSKLKKAIASPCGAGSSSFIETLTEESPLLKTPPLCRKLNKKLNLSDTPKPKLQLSPDLFEESPQTKLKRHCHDDDIKFVKISSARENNSAKRPKLEVQDTNNLKYLGSLNIFKKKKGPVCSSVIRKGYDGLGGHTTFTQPLGPPKFGGPKKSVSKSQPAKKSKTNFKCPPLPTMDGFLP